MSDGQYLMIPAEEYSEMEKLIEDQNDRIHKQIDRINRLEKALDKACAVIKRNRIFAITDKEFIFTIEQWKECLIK